MWPVFEIVVRGVVGVFMLLAGVAKLSAGPVWRAKWLGAYRLVPSRAVGAVAFWVAVAEVLGGAVVLAGAGNRAGLVAAAGLLFLVTGAVAVSLARGLRVPCGCLGSFGQLITWRIVVRNLVMLAALAVLARHGAGAGVAVLSWPAQAGVVAAMLAAAVLLGVRPRSRRPPQPPAEPAGQAGEQPRPADALVPADADERHNRS
jgi:hypothetical protein